MKYHLAILKNETESDHLPWIESCEKKKDLLSWTVVDITKDDWMDKITAEKFDCVLSRPPGLISYFKQLYDERLYYIHYILGLNIYPTYIENIFYENKRALAYWLKYSGFQHPATHIFYDKEDAMNYAENAALPIVAKTAIGAGGSGVRIFRDKEAVRNYIHKAFSDTGITRTWGPNLRKGNILNRVLKRLSMPGETLRYFRQKKQSATIDPQRWFVLFQDYVEAEFEWRAVKVGESFFAHKKLRSIGEMISGTSNVSWDGPDEKLLNFMKAICDKGNFYSQSIDILVDKEGNYYINELQCFWGSKNPHQMILDGIPGRYIFKDGNWVFEEGTFNSNNSYDLRVEHVLNLLKNGQFGK